MQLTPDLQNMVRNKEISYADAVKIMGQPSVAAAAAPGEVEAKAESHNVT